MHATSKRRRWLLAHELNVIEALNGERARALGLAAHPQQGAGCVQAAFDCGVNYFFAYGPGHTRFIGELARIARKQRDEIILATGSGSRKPSGLVASRRKLAAALGTDMIDVFFAEYLHPHDNEDAIFGNGGVLDELAQWKVSGEIRYTGATVHDRALAKRLAEDPRVDVLMHRFNMAHRKAASEVFPTAVRTKTPVVAFTATRWATLLKAPDGWSGEPPIAADCYRYCLAHRAVQLVLTAPRSVSEMKENRVVIESGRMSARERCRWENYGDWVYRHGKDAFETRWP